MSSPFKRRARKRLPQPRLPRVERLESRQLLATDGLSLVVDNVSVEQNSDTITIDVLANDTFDIDYSGDRKITSLSTGSLGGRLEISNDGDSIRYTAPADIVGRETFRYTVDRSASAAVTIEISSPLRDFETSVYLFRDEYRLDVLAGATFADDYAGDRRITLISDSVLGADLSISDDGTSVIYQSRVGFQGKDRFSYVVDDVYFGTAIVNVINPLEADRYEVVQYSSRVQLPVLANDFLNGADPSIDLSAVRRDARITHVINDTDNFQITIAADGRSVEFLSDEGFAGDDHSGVYGYRSFRYVVDGRFETTASVYVHRPVRDDYYMADSDGGQHSFDVLANDEYRSIFGGDIRLVNEVTSVTQGDQGGSVEVSPDGRSIIYTPANGFEGSENFRYIADGKYTANVTVNLTSPVRDDFLVAYVGADNQFDVLENDFHGSAEEDFEITSVSESLIGASIQIQPSEILTYRPPANAFDGDSPIYSDSFSYTVNGTRTANVRVRLARITSGDFYAVDQPISRTLNVLENDHFASGYPGNGVITSVTAASGGGIVSIATDGRSLVYQPGSDRETFTYTVDNQFRESVTIVPITRLIDDHAVTDQNGSGITVDVVANDFPAYSYVIREHGHYQGARQLTDVSSSENGAIVTIDANGKVSYVPALDFVGRDTFTYTIDGFLTAQAHVDVIRRVHDDVVHVSPGSSETLNVLGNDILGADYEGNGLITDVGPALSGADIQISSDGRSIVYTAPIGFQGQDQFAYTLDGQSKATVAVVVNQDSTRSLGKFESVEQLRDYLLDLSIERFKHQFGQPGYVNDPRYLDDRAETFSTSADPTFSETNVQIAGVDEDDIVETDGNFIYSLRGDELAIVSSLPADELRVLSRTSIEGSPTGMYLNGDRVTVISRLSEPVTPFAEQNLSPTFASDIAYFPYEPPQLTTIVTVLDVSDRESPTIVQRTTMDGDFSATRRIEDQVFVILNSNDLVLEPKLLPVDDDASMVFETQQQFTERVLDGFATILSDLLPSYQSFDRDGELIRSGPIVLPEDIYQGLKTESSMTVVTSLNMASSEPGLASASAVLSAASSEIFATAEHLFAFSPGRSMGEDPRPVTDILKFDWDGQSGAIEFAATGSVPGRLLNQFSADELNGDLRVVTEVSNFGTGNFSGRNETTLYVLEDDHGTLEFVGSLQNLAVGQNVKSVRFFDNRVFVTTFETVDPLYAIDLSDPTQPRVMGHVSIPGFNSYMQFVDEDRLLTVGVNSANGVGGRAVVSLFDVGNMTAPRLIDRYDLPKFSTSEANFDHHAFGWFASHKLLALPVSSSFQDRFDEDGDGYREAIRWVQEDSLSILHIGRDESSGEEHIGLRGKIDHDAKVQRSVRINNHVYSVGTDAIRSVDALDPSVIVGEVRFGDDVGAVTEFVPRHDFDVTQLSEAARNKLAASTGMGLGEVLFITHENYDGESEVILRAGEQQYRFRSHAENGVELLDTEFAFIDGWHNSKNHWDVNADNSVTSADALIIINELSRGLGTDFPADRAFRQVNALPKFVDANNDGNVTAIDALLVINALSRQSVTPADAEFADVLPRYTPRISAGVVDAVFDEFSRRDEDKIRTGNSLLF